MTKLEFRIHPPAAVSAYVSRPVVIDCTASVAPGLPLAMTEWTKSPPPLCKETPQQLNVSRNGSLFFSQAKMQDEGFYTCKAFARDEIITATTYLQMTPCRVNAICVIKTLVICLSYYS